MASRRTFLLAALAVPLGCAAPAARPKFNAPPFSLGVASGYPRADGMVLWTRLAPRPLEGGGMDPERVSVDWEVAEDERFARIVRSGRAVAAPTRAHSVHVEVQGLRPARGYFYRFIAGGEASPVGRTRTAPVEAEAARLRLALASCQQYEQGYYVAHRHLAAEDVDVVAFVGDYIYESSWGRDRVRQHGTAEPGTLDEYRHRYALYKSDADLQRAHAAAPWVVTWDDHEVDNDYAGEQSEELHPAHHFLRRRAAAYQAFAEHMPLPLSMLTASQEVRIYTHLDWGRLARLHILDNRQYRVPQACPRPYRGGGNVVGAECAERLRADRSMLGSAQEEWLERSLADSRAGWNLLVQQTLFGPGATQGEQGMSYWTDGWDGYPATRAKVLQALARHRVSNPVVLGGDLHAAVSANVHAGDRDDAPVVAAEIVCTSITSQGPRAGLIDSMRSAQRRIRYANGAARGYAVLELTAERLEARHRAVETVKRTESAVRTASTATVEAGRPGWQ